MRGLNVTDIFKSHFDELGDYLLEGDNVFGYLFFNIAQKVLVVHQDAIQLFIVELKREGLGKSEKIIGFGYERSNQIFIKNLLNNGPIIGIWKTEIPGNLLHFRIVDFYEILSEKMSEVVKIHHVVNVFLLSDFESFKERLLVDDYFEGKIFLGNFER